MLLQWVFLRSGYFTQTRGLSYKKLISWYSGLVKPKPKEAPFDHIIQIGDPTLRVISETIPSNLIKSPEINFLINKMKKVMKCYNCVGLSAPQIGIPVRLMVLEFNHEHINYHSPQERKIRDIEVVPLKIVINPEIQIIDYTKLIFPETCESVRGFCADVPRYKAVKLKGFNEEGQSVEIQATGWTARIIQHEVDHLNGIIYTDIMDRKSLTCSCWEIINERGGKVELPYGPS